MHAQKGFRQLILSICHSVSEKFLKSTHLQD